MRQWRFEITDNGEADITKLDSSVRRRILKKLKWFMDNFENVIPLPLGGPLKGFFKLRIGDWRVIYEAEEEKGLVTVHSIDHRNKIYKIFKRRYFKNSSL